MPMYGVTQRHACTEREREREKDKERERERERKRERETWFIHVFSARGLFTLAKLALVLNERILSRLF